MIFARPAPTSPGSRPWRFFTFFLILSVLVTAGCASENDDGAGNVPSTSQPAAGLSSDAQIQEPEDPPDISDVTFETMDGETIALAERSGEVLLVNFWATWCAPCRKEIPDLIDLQDELGPRGLTVVGVSMDQQGAEDVTPFLDDYAINYPIVLDPEATLEDTFGSIYGLPMTFVVGPEGRIRYQILGALPADEVRPHLTALLDEAG